jgi:hypothetical protein
MSPVAQKYIAAYAGILTPAELKKTSWEEAEFAKSLPPVLPHFPGTIRQTAGRLPDTIKATKVKDESRKFDDKGYDYTRVTGEVYNKERHTSFAGQQGAEGKKDYNPKLNYQTFLLTKDGEQLERAGELYNLFKPGKEKDWPTLVLASNSNLVSPQLFFDNLSSAYQLVPALAGVAKDKLRVAGTYFSQRHLYANAADTIKRYQELGLNPESLEGTSPAAQAQAYQILDLLIARDGDGRVMIDDNKPILRKNAYEVLRHVIGYGYSAAHMTNKDGFRILRDIISKGEVKIDMGKDVVRDSRASDAERLLSEVRLIGIGGTDRMDIGPEKSMPREVNLVSPKDFSNAVNGPRFLKAANVIQIKMRDDDGNAIKDNIGGHSLDSYIEAILSKANAQPREEALYEIGNGRMVAGPGF